MTGYRVRQLICRVMFMALAALWCCKAVAQGEPPGTLMYQGVERHYVLHKPPNQTGTGASNLGLMLALSMR